MLCNIEIPNFKFFIPPSVPTYLPICRAVWAGQKFKMLL